MVEGGIVGDGLHKSGLLEGGSCKIGMHRVGRHKIKALGVHVRISLKMKRHRGHYYD